MVATIQVESRTKDVDIVVFTHVSVITREDRMHQQVWFAGKKKVAFDIAMEKDTFFKARHETARNLGKLPIIDMPSTFDPSIEVGPSQQHGTLQ